MRSARLLVALGLLLPLGSACAPRPPNVVLVIADDQGWTDSGFMGHPTIQTPTLDRLADGGTVFTQAQTPASMCRPSLQALLSGLHPRQWEAKRDALSQTRQIPYREEVEYFRTLPRELARRGYRSWEGGKMWEGSARQAGFDAGTAGPGPFGLFDEPDFGRAGWDPERCGSRRTGDEPCPALALLREFLDGVGDDPFFVWFAPMLPHEPFDPPPEFERIYRGRGLSHDEVLYFAQVSRLDALIGELLRELDDRGLREDTLIVYVSDNGWQIGQAELGRVGHGKTSLHELGTRAPIVFHWSGHVPAGVRREDLVGIESIFSTILDFAGGEPLPDRRGPSLLPAIEDGQAVGLDRYVSFQRAPGRYNSGYFVRTPRWRYSVLQSGREALYDIREDPYETTDLAAARSELLPDFRAAIDAWEREIATAPERLEITGTLVSDDERALPQVPLTLESTSDASQPLRETRTDARGAFRFRDLPHGSYRLATGAGSYRLASEVLVSLPVGPVGSHLPPLVAVETASPRASP